MVVPYGRYDGDEFRRKWEEMEDPESASAKGVRFFEDVLNNRIDPLKYLDVLRVAVEPAWDGPHGKIHTVHEGLLKVEIAVYDAERKLPLGAPEQLALQALAQNLVAKSWHRKKYYKQAVLVAFAMIKRLEDLVGRKQLLEIVARPTPNAIAEAAVEMLGVLIASLRRAEDRGEFRPTTAREIHQIAFNIVKAYLGPELHPRVIYPGTPGLVAQWFYRFVHDASAAEDFVVALYELDVEVRPDRKRSRVTAHARDAEYAAFQGNRERARQEANSFITALGRLGMVRHLKTIEEQGYFVGRA